MSVIASNLPIPDDRFCIENGVLIATAGYYRFSLSLSLATSVFSASYLIYFFQKHYKNLSFHFNIKVLLLSLYSCCFLYSCVNIVMKVHHLVLPLLISTPCQIFLPVPVYVSTHLPLVFVSFMSQFTQIAMILERCVATISVRDYEYGYRKLGVGLLVATVIASLGTMLVLYQREKFDGLYLNGRMLPQSTYAVANVILVEMLCVNFFGLVSTIALHFVNQRRQIRVSLSSKFQSMENRVTSDLLFWVSSVQFTTVVLTDIATLLLRLYMQDNRLAMAFKENVDFFNVYTLFLPFITTVYIVKVKKRRIMDINFNINMKSVGNEGWRNYCAVTQELWK